MKAGVQELRGPALVAVVAAVAAELGEGWTVVREVEDDDSPRRWYVNVGHTDGRTLHFGTIHTDRARLVVSGHYPKDGAASMSASSWFVLDHNASAPEMTVAGDRPAAKVAADVARRLLPEYTRLWGLCIAKKAERDAARAAQAAAVAAIVTAYGVRFDGRDADRPNGQTPYNNGAPRVECTVGWAGRYVTLKVDLTPAEAVALAPLLTVKRTHDLDGEPIE